MEQHMQLCSALHPLKMRMCMEFNILMGNVFVKILSWCAPVSFYFTQEKFPDYSRTGEKI